MAKRVNVDKTLFAVTLLLLAIGLVMVFSASAVMASERFGSAYTFLLRQLAWVGAGLAVMVLLMRVDYRRWRHPAVIFALLGVTSALLLAVFFLDRSHHTHRWIRFGPLSFQPSELAKLALIFYLAYFLEKRASDINDWRGTLLPALLPPALFAALILKQPDLGTAMVCLAVTAILLFVAGMRLRYFVGGLVGLLPVLYFLVFRVRWRYERLLAFIDPYSDPQGRGFHIIQSLIAVGTGGVTGVGLMEGRQKLFYLPEPHTDFIFAVTAEEFGLVGSLVVLGLFAVFFYRGMRAALRSRELFGRYLALGITSMIAMQALLNMSVVLALLPTKGIPLPFVSYGGSSLFVTLAGMGVLLNITQQTE